MPYLTAKGDQQVILDLYVQPKASRTRITGLHDGSIKLTITAPPIEGKANSQVTTFMAKLFKIPKSSITLMSGHQGRHKRIAIAGITQDEIRRILAPLLCT
jgi:uncharacterized protein (TIGR00251 family)